MRKMLKEALRSLYEAMLKDEKISVLSERNYCCMAPYVGSKFPTTANDGIIFYGRANNGWETGVDGDFDTIYNKGSEGLTDYINDNCSPFFRTAGKAFSNYYGEEWHEYTAYSNLYKVAPSASNPEAKIRNYQWEYVADIFMKEIEILSPKFAVLFTNEDWGWKFLHYINNKENPQFLCSENWDKYRIDIYKIGDVYYLISEHPQGKPEQEHADAILRVIQDVKEGRL